MKNCFLCELEITNSNDSSEHIIPNAIGGKKKVRGFVCNDCNNKSGAEWDTELCNQLNALCLLFNIRRERGEVPSQIFETTSGNKLVLNNDGSFSQHEPDFKEFLTEDKVNISIRARTMREARIMLKGISRKYPHAPIEQFLEELEETAFYPLDGINFNISFGGDESGRSLVKSALALASQIGIRPGDCEHAIEYLKNKGESCWGYYYEKDIVRNRPENTPLHCVYVKGDPDSQLVLAYVEFFGCQRMVLCLSHQYVGDKLEGQYSINPVTSEALNLDVELDFDLGDIQSIYANERVSNHEMKDAIGRMMFLGQKMFFDREKERVVTDAVKYALENCGAKKGEVLTEEQLNRLNGLMWEKMESFITHTIRLGRQYTYNKRG